MRIAVLSDTHGNLTAFEAVLADIDSRGISRVLHLGDVAGKGPRGSDCCTLARERCEIVIRGNWDVFLLRDPTKLSDASRWWQNELTPLHHQWLARLPFSIDLQIASTPVRCFHALSDSVFHRIYPTVHGQEWNDLFANTNATGDGMLPYVAIYGDIHYAYSRTEGEHALLNCGSVGNPLDQPTASYIVLDDCEGSFHWEIVRVPYDIESELTIARRMDMPDYDAWAQELRTAEYAR